MKYEYKSPMITVEELAKADVLCESQINPPTYHDDQATNWNNFANNGMAGLT